MGPRAILTYPDPRLRMRSRPVDSFGPDLARLVDELIDTMHAARAIGLAAPQLDVHLRVLTLDVSEGRVRPEVFINPEVLARGSPGMVEESCLSVPGIVASVPRATRVQVRTADRSGNVSVRELEGQSAVCLLHEIDHLDGTLFIDRLPFFERRRVRRQLESTATPGRLEAPSPPGQARRG